MGGRRGAAVARAIVLPTASSDHRDWHWQVECGLGVRARLSPLADCQAASSSSFVTFKQAYMRLYAFRLLTHSSSLAVTGTGVRAWPEAMGFNPSSSESPLALASELIRTCDVGRYRSGS